jgi:hypothetical protein
MLFNVHSLMLMAKILINHQHVIGQNIHVKAWNFECEMDFQ